MTHHARTSIGLPRASHAAQLVLAAAIACAGFTQPVQAKKNCVEHSRDLSNYDGISAHTSVHNDTKEQTFLVEIIRNKKAKATKSVGPGDKVDDLSRFHGDINITVKFNQTGSKNSVVCAYVLKEIESSVQWSLADGADAACSTDAGLCSNGCEVACLSNYHPDKQRWNTSFRISDGS